MPRTGIQLGVIATALGSDVSAAVLAARQAGIAGLQFDTISSLVDLTGLSASGRREFLRLLAQQQRQLVGLRTTTGDKGVARGADVDRVVDHLSKSMAAAADLQTPLVCVDIGPLPEPAPEPAKPRSTITPEQAGLLLLPDASILPSASAAPAAPLMPVDAEAFAHVDAALAEIGRHADRYSVMLAFRSDLSSLAALDRALRSVGCPWFGVDLDPVSLLKDEWPIDEAFSRLGPHIRHVRGRDALGSTQRGAQRRTRPAILGRGSVDWPALLAALEQTAYNGWLTIDPIELTDRRAATTAAAAHLQKLLAR